MTDIEEIRKLVVQHKGNIDTKKYDTVHNVTAGGVLVLVEINFAILERLDIIAKELKIIGRG